MDGYELTPATCQNFNRRQFSNEWNGGGFNADQSAQLQYGADPTPRGRPTGKITISNLDYNVTDDDIRELMNEFGDIVKYAVHYDRSGRSMGFAEVQFKNPETAMEARKKYQGVPLDGKRMSIEVEMTGGSIAGRLGPMPARQFNRGGGRMNGFGGGGGGGFTRGGFNRRSGGGFNRGGGFGNRQGGYNRRRDNDSKMENITAADLDAELDAYKSGK